MEKTKGMKSYMSDIEEKSFSDYASDYTSFHTMILTIEIIHLTKSNLQLRLVFNSLALASNLRLLSNELATEFFISSTPAYENK